MIVKKITTLILSISLLKATNGASYSRVFVGSENSPVRYYRHGAPYAVSAIASPQLAQIKTLPLSASAFVTPCVLPCTIPEQRIAEVPANIVTYNAPYANVPVAISPAKEEATGYEYSYVVYDENTGDHKAQRELSDGSVVRGEYSFLQPDGYVREVKYVADDVNGFNAVVKNFLPTALDSTTKIEPKIRKEPTQPCHDVHKESIIEAPSEKSSESNQHTHEEHSQENHRELQHEPVSEHGYKHNDHIEHVQEPEHILGHGLKSAHGNVVLETEHSHKHSEADGNKEHSSEIKYSHLEHNSKEFTGNNEHDSKGHSKEIFKVTNSESEVKTSIESHEGAEELKKKSTKEPSEKSSEKSSEESKEIHAGGHSIESSEGSTEKSKEVSSEKSNEASSEESKEYHVKKHKKSSSDKSHEKLAKSSKKESSEETEEDIENKHNKNSKKVSKEESDEPEEDSSEEILVQVGKRKGGHVLMLSQHEPLIPYHDVIRCVQATIKRAQEKPAAIKEEPSPLTYIILNKPC